MIINSFSIIDIDKKEAGSFEFSTEANLIVSNENTQGKSSLLKSMYYTLGFDIRQFPSNWDINQMYFQLNVSIQNETYQITRQKNIFTINGTNEIMNAKEYSAWFQNKLGIKMQLANTRTQNLHNAYSSAVILPFYIDQDDSWDGGLYKSVTDTVSQYSSVPQDIFKSVFGLSNTEVLELQNLNKNTKKEKNELQSSIENLQKVLDEYRKANEHIQEVEKINADSLKNEINTYLSIQNEFHEDIKKYKVKLLNKKSILDQQKQELAELDELLKMNQKRYKTIEKNCTYCNSKLTTEQSLTRLGLSDNFLDISRLKNEVTKEIEKISNEIDELKSHQDTLEFKANEILRKISDSNNLLTIDEYVKASAKNETTYELQSLIDNQLLYKIKLEDKIKLYNREIIKLKKEMKGLTETIEREYDRIVYELSFNLKSVEINELKFLQFKKIPGSGTDKNKKYLSYYLVYFSLLNKFSSYKIPFCMDSFIKNEITGESAREMFGAIEKYFFNDNEQSFFSIIKENIKHFNTPEKYHKIQIGERLLSKERYNDVEKKFNI